MLQNLISIFVPVLIGFQMEKEHKIILTRVLISGTLLGASFIPSFSETVRIILCMGAYLTAGYDVLYHALLRLFKGRFLDEHFLMAIATIGATVLGEYPEAAAVMLFFQVGELFQDMAVGKSRASIAALMDIRPEFAHLENEKGEFVKTDPDKVPVNSTIVVMPGEKIPLDGIVVSGHSSLNLSALTGESLPQEVHEGQNVLSGSLNLSGLLRIKTTSVYAQSTVARILELVQNTPDNKSQSERFITRFARYYTPVVVAVAVLIALIPSLFVDGQWTEWLHRALVFLVVSCPCALVISVPLSFFAGIGYASKKGILVKGAYFMEILSAVRTVVFDKTGTLTKGEFSVQDICPADGIQKEELLELAAIAESFSTHPIAAGIRQAYEKDPDTSRLQYLDNIDGEGIKAVIDNKNVYVGNTKLIRRTWPDFMPAQANGILVHLCSDKSYLGYIILADSLKTQTAQAIEALRKAGVHRTVILTGDRKEVADEIAAKLDINECYAELLPQEKVKKMEELRASGYGRVAFIGDGINDAPVLKCSDVGIAMGAIGSDAAIEAADVVLMDDNPLKIATAIRISKRTRNIVRQNIVLSIGIKVVVLALGTFGLANMWEAVFADVGVTVVAVLNAIRAMYLKKQNKL